MGQPCLPAVPAHANHFHLGRVLSQGTPAGGLASELEAAGRRAVCQSASLDRDSREQSEPLGLGQCQGGCWLP